jgi:hypothetical protein
MAHRELGPEYSDAVVASFIEKVDLAVAARVEARLADLAESEPAQLRRRGQRLLTRRVARDVLAASAGALVVVGAVGLHALTSPPVGGAAGSSPVVHVRPGGPAVLPPAFQSRLKGTSGLRHFTVILPPGANTR